MISSNFKPLASMFSRAADTAAFGRVMHGSLVAAGLLLFVMSLLCIFKAPAFPFWIPAIVATEWGHLLAIFCLLLVAFMDPTPRYGHGLRLVSVVSAALFLSPLVRSTFLIRRLPSDMSRAFGPVTVRHGGLQFPARAAPLSIKDLYLGVGSSQVSVTSYVYSSVSGIPLSLDVYNAAPKSVSLPALLVIHGGSWKSGDRKELPALNRYLAARGYLVVSIDYRLAPRWLFPAARDDVFQAIAYLKKHAGELGWNGRQMVLLGRSAGGQIALSAAYSEKEPAIRGAIVFYTPNDLVFGYSIPGNPLIMNSQKVISDYLGGPLNKIPDVYKAASPLLEVNAKTPPTLMIHGGRDELVWSVHDDRLSSKLAQAGRPHYYLRLPWATHGCDANFSGPCGQLSTYAIERFLAAVMPAAENS